MLLAAWFDTIINFDNFGQLLPLVYPSIIAAMILGVLAGLIGPLIQARDMAFAVHGTAELSFAGAACALWLGSSVILGAVVGSMLAGTILALMGLDGKNRNSLIGIMLPFGLGLGVLFLSLYQGRSSNKFGLLTGQIVAVTPAELQGMVIVAVIVLAVLALFGQRMLFAAIDRLILIVYVDLKSGGSRECAICRCAFIVVVADYANGSRNASHGKSDLGVWVVGVICNDGGRGWYFAITWPRIADITLYHHGVVFDLFDMLGHW